MPRFVFLSPSCICQSVGSKKKVSRPRTSVGKKIGRKISSLALEFPHAKCSSLNFFVRTHSLFPVVFRVYHVQNIRNKLPHFLILFPLSREEARGTIFPVDLSRRAPPKSFLLPSLSSFSFGRLSADWRGGGKEEKEYSKGASFPLISSSFSLSRKKLWKGGERERKRLNLSFTSLRMRTHSLFHSWVRFVYLLFLFSLARLNIFKERRGICSFCWSHVRVFPFLIMRKKNMPARMEQEKCTHLLSRQK